MTTDHAIQTALKLHQAGELGRAEAIYAAVLQTEPRHADALHLLGLIAHQAGRAEVAIDRIRRAIEVNGRVPAYHHNLSLAYAAADRKADAVAAAREAVRLAPRDAHNHDNLGYALLEDGRAEEAVASFGEAVARKPDLAKAHNNLGAAYYELGRLDQSAAASRRALALDPNYAKAHNTLALTIQLQGHVAEAMRHFQEATRLDAGYVDARWNLALAHLLTGQFDRGWPDYELRFRRRGQRVRRAPWPAWNGEPLAGKTILIYGEQGIGDEIMFLSCVADVVELAGRCVVECDQRLAPLAERSFPTAGVYPRRETDELDWIGEHETLDLRVAVGSLPGRMWTNAVGGRGLAALDPSHAVFGDDEKQAGYLVPDAARGDQWRRRLDQLGKGPKIGLSWRGGLTPAETLRRSIPLSAWKNLLAVSGCRFVNLQHDGTPAEIQAALGPAARQLADWPDVDRRRDFEELAAEIAALDLIVTVDNTTAHLAGALGRPVWIALPLVPEWRWMLHRDDSPWYPTARLFRQSQPGRWDDVVDRIITAAVADFARIQRCTTSKVTATATASDSTKRTAPRNPGLAAGAMADVMSTALVHHRGGRLHEARGIYESILATEPDHADALHLGGLVAHQLGDGAAGTVLVERAIALDSTNAAYHNNLGTIYAALGQLPRAIACYRRAIEHNDTLADAHNNLAGALKQQERADEAAGSYRRALELRRDKPPWELRARSLCPAVFDGAEQIDRYRQELLAWLQQFAGRKFAVSLDELPASCCGPPFNLQFHGRDDLPIRAAYADVFRGRLPELTPLRNTGRPRIGLVVSAAQMSIFLRSLGGVIERLPAGRFQLVVVSSPAGCSQFRRTLGEEPAGCLPLPDRFEQSVDAIRQARFDMLYHWDPSTSAVNYFLSLLRLAPVQCTSWGIQVTSGSPEIDAYLSSRLVEPPGADRHYRERLQLSDTLLTYQRPVAPPSAARDRESLGFSSSQHLYVCAQQLGKFHPDFDHLLGAILRRDPRGTVVAVRDRHGCVARSLLHRLERTIGDVIDRLVFLPWQDRGGYLSLLAAADVLLDPLHFGGVNTTYDGLALHQPIVTLPGRFHRGRYTYGCYRKMGVMDCVARDAEDYVTRAVSLATDDQRRHEVVHRIRQTAAVLFEDAAAVREHQRLFEELLNVEKGTGAYIGGNASFRTN